jgi:hypothetical protein
VETGADDRPVELSAKFYGRAQSERGTAADLVRYCRRQSLRNTFVQLFLASYHHAILNL